MRATSRVDAFGGQELNGKVIKIDAFPMPGSWYSSNIKEYGATISIDSPNENLRPGMTAEVEIHVESVDEVITVPVQTVFEHGSKHYCLVKKDDELEAREITIGSTNDKYVVVEAGLKDDAQVVLNPRNYLDYLELPEVEELELETQFAKADGKPAADDNDPRSSEAGAEKGDTEKGDTEKGDTEKGGLGQRGAGKGTAGKGGPGSGGPGGSRDPQAMAKSILVGMDKNSDGKIDRDEWPADRADGFDPADKNNDGSIDEGEFQAAMKKVIATMQAGGGTGGGGGPSGGTAGPGS
jgi:hypothetical protein